MSRESRREALRDKITAGTKCGDCGGDGLTATNIGAMPVTIPCEACDGTGRDPAGIENVVKAIGELVLDIDNRLEAMRRTLGG